MHSDPNTGRKVRIVLVALLALAAVAAGPAASLASAQEVVFLVRHAERLDSTADSPLSDAGRQRAERLAQMLRDAGVTSIFVTEYQRTVQTAEPLSDLLKLSPVVTQAADSPALVARLRALGPRARALVVSHSDRLPELLQALGYDRQVVIPAYQYDDLFVVVPGGGQKKPVVVQMKY